MSASRCSLLARDCHPRITVLPHAWSMSSTLEERSVRPPRTWGPRDILRLRRGDDHEGGAGHACVRWLGMSTPDAPVIEAQGLRRDYVVGGEVVHALGGADLRVERNEYVAIMGPSGSGKSTLMNILGCLDTPTAGVPARGPTRQRRWTTTQLARDPQPRDRIRLPDVQPAGAATALHNVELPLIYAGACRGGSDAARGQKALARSGSATGCSTAERTLRRPAAAGGDRPGAGRAARSILLADEPTGNLDSETGEEIMGAIRRRCIRGATPSSSSRTSPTSPSMRIA